MTDTNTEFPGIDGIDVLEVEDRRRDMSLRQVIHVARRMAERLSHLAEEQGDWLGSELVEQWQDVLRDLRRPQAERIGRCDWCGLVDHHLVDGICASCADKSHTVGGAL